MLCERQSYFVTAGICSSIVIRLDNLIYLYDYHIEYLNLHQSKADYKTNTRSF
jgi:hypothetical protein